MKRILTGLLAVFLLMTGCAQETPQPTTATTVPETLPPPPTAAVVATGESVENEWFRVTLEGTDPEAVEGFTLQLCLENKTDRALELALVSLTVNDFVSHKQWAQMLQAGKSTRVSLSVADDAYMQTGEALGKLELALAVREDGVALPESLLHLAYLPSGSWTRTEVTVGSFEVLVDNEYLTLAVVGYDPEDALGYGVQFYLENKTGHDLLFALQEEKVNASPCEAVLAGTVPAGKRSFATASWYLADLQKLAIGEVEKLELPFAVYDMTDQLLPPVLEETFILQP